MTDTFKDIEKLEADLWAAADNLRVNARITSSGEFMCAEVSPNDHGRNQAGTINPWH